MLLFANIGLARGQGGLRPGAGRGGCEAGFTLFELLLVFAIIGLVVNVAFYSGRPASRSASLKSAALQTAAILRGTRAISINRKIVTTVIIDVRRRIIKRVGGRPFQLSIPDGIGITLTAAAGRRRLRHVGRIEFFPNGSSTGGALRYQRGGRSIVVRVNWLTGRVSVAAAS